jgi:hypothetical protein
MATPKPVPHVHSDDRVDIARVDAFVESSRQARLDALTELRRRVSDDSTTIELGLGGGLIGVAVSLLLPYSPISFPDTVLSVEVLARLVAGFAVGAIFIVALLPALIPMARRSRKREIADAWIRAYEDEVAARWNRRDKAALRWQRAQR